MSNPKEPQETPAQSNVLSRLFGSRKFIVLIVAVAAVAVFVALGRVTFDQFVVFLTVTVPTFLGATAWEDAAEKRANTSKSLPVELFAESISSKFESKESTEKPIEPTTVDAKTRPTSPEIKK